MAILSAYKRDECSTDEARVLAFLQREDALRRGEVALKESALLDDGQ